MKIQLLTLALNEPEFESTMKRHELTILGGEEDALLSLTYYPQPRVLLVRLLWCIRGRFYIAQDGYTYWSWDRRD